MKSSERVKIWFRSSEEVKKMLVCCLALMAFNFECCIYSRFLSYRYSYINQILKWKKLHRMLEFWFLSSISLIKGVTVGYWWRGFADGCHPYFKTLKGKNVIVYRFNRFHSFIHSFIHCLFVKATYRIFQLTKAFRVAAPFHNISHCSRNFSGVPPPKIFV